MAVVRVQLSVKTLNQQITRILQGKRLANGIPFSYTSRVNITIHERHKTMNYEQEKALLELVDKMYETVESFGIEEDLVREWAEQVKGDIADNTDFTREQLDK